MKKILFTIFNIIKSINPFSTKDTDNKILYTLKILLTTQVIYFLTLVIAEGVIIGISYFFGYNATDKQMPQDITSIISFFGYIIPIMVFILYTKKINKSKADRIGLNNNFKPFIKGLLVGIITLIFVIVPLLLCGAVSFNGINSYINWLFIILFFFAYLIQSAMEEVVCRGFIFHRLKEKIPVVFAMAINVVFFLIGHWSKMFDAGMLIGIIGISNAILIGVIFTVLTIQDKNIYSAIGFHYIWNFGLNCIIGLSASGNDSTNAIFNMSPVNTFLTGSSYGVESSVICTIVYSIVLAVILISKRKVKVS